MQSRVLLSPLAEQGLGTRAVDNSIITSKYTLLNFLPKSLFEQFRRLANVYFLVLSGLMLLGTYSPSTFDTPLTPYSTLVPLVVVLMCSMTREAYEDFKRHLTDRKTNSRVAKRHVYKQDLNSQMLSSPPSYASSLLTSLGLGFERSRRSTQVEMEDQLMDVTWEDIRKGHVIRVYNKEPIPADMVVLNTDDSESGICYVETSNIDGETNLKMKKAILESPHHVAHLVSVSTEQPNGNIHVFSAVCELEDGRDSISVDSSSFLLRGSTLQNVQYVDGLVVFVGQESKLAINNSKHGPRLKLSSVEKTMNRLIRMVFGFLFALVATSVVLKLSLPNEKFPYLFGSGEAFSLPTPVAYFFTFLILFSNALPMSLYVTVEMVNVGHAYFIDQDLAMYDKTTGLPARAVTSNLNSDLGQVEFLFSDKTGTLTKNEMTLKRVSVNGIIYGPKLLELDAGEEVHDATSFSPPPPLEDLLNDSEADRFLTCVSICHTVQISQDADGAYRAESPDELALCEGAGKRWNRVFTQRIGQTAIQVNDNEYTILCVNEFTSKRKRMSILFEFPNQQGYFLCCKGADTAMLTNECRPLEDHLVEFASEGLRTLVFGIKQVDSITAKAWLNEFTQAKNLVGEEREVKLEQIANKMESEDGMEILGCTAIEDELQDGVPETLQALRDAGIRIMVLTGDKLETAINIGYSARLLDANMTIIRIEGKSVDVVRYQLENILGLFPIETRPSFADLSKKRLRRAAGSWLNLLDMRSVRQESVHTEPLMHDRHRQGKDEEPLALAITGVALEYALQDAELRKMLLSLVLMSKVVMCCRVSPSQKAQMVRLVKKGADDHSRNVVTLAIGDGANDCAMISEAQVGVGISGHEGLQAVNASDFAISQFRFLKPLLLVHGRWSYRRMSKVILYSLYKNLVLVLLLFYYQFYCAFSGQSLYEPMVQAGFNFFLGMSPFVLGLFDREISSRFALLHPQLYVSGRRNLNLNLVKLGWRVIESLVHSFIVFFIPLYVLDDPSKSDLYTVGVTSYTCLIFVLQYKILMESSSFTKFTLYAWLFSFTLYFGFLFVYNAWYMEAPEFYWVAFASVVRPQLWWLVLLCTSCTFVFDVSIKLARLTFNPHAVDILIEQDRLASKLLFVLTEGNEGKRESILPDLNHYELSQRMQSLTPADLDALGIDTPQLRSSFDFAYADRLHDVRRGGNGNGGMREIPVHEEEEEEESYHRV
ncbi:hypothetical protein BASA81_001219 [Batrachochytrium salamandrivorans]|nr:hypothetical protein BASA81_001219 [Batrachochytrium salamandrivorans]